MSSIRDEMNSLGKNQTLELVPKPKDKPMVRCKWVYKVKKGITKIEPLRYKARWVAKEYTKKG